MLGFGISINDPAAWSLLLRPTRLLLRPTRPWSVVWHIFFAAFSRALASASSVASWGIFFRGVLALPLHGFSLLFAALRGVLVRLFVSREPAPRGEYFMGVSCLIEFFLRQGCSMLVIRNGTIVEQSMTVIHHMLGRIQGLVPCWELREFHR